MAGCHVKPEQMFNLIFGYNDRYVEEVIVAADGAGSALLAFTAVPLDEVWRIEGMSARQETATRGNLEGRLDLGGVVVSVIPYQALTVWVYVIWTGVLTMKSGDMVSILVTGANAGDSIRGHAWGYKMKLTQ